MNTHGNAAAVILDGNPAIGKQGHLDMLAIARKRLIGSVVDDFLNNM